MHLNNSSNKNNYIIKSLLIIVNCVWSTFSVFTYINMPYNTILFLTIIIGIISLLKAAIKINDKRYMKYSAVFSVILSIAFVVGKNVYSAKNINANPLLGTFFIDIFNIIGLSFIFCCVFIVLINFLIHKEFELSDSKIKLRFFFICWVIIFSSWLIYYFNFYPCIITDDSLMSWQQVRGVDQYGNYHPIVFTLFIKLCYTIGSFFGGPNVRAAFYSIIQMFD